MAEILFHELGRVRLMTDSDTVNRIVPIPPHQVSESLTESQWLALQFKEEDG